MFCLSQWNFSITDLTSLKSDGYLIEGSGNFFNKAIKSLSFFISENAWWIGG
jgi:hypothetical protein